MIFGFVWNFFFEVPNSLRNNLLKFDGYGSVNEIFFLICIFKNLKIENKWLCFHPKYLFFF